MIRLLRDFRLVPIVLFATITLFVLKTIGLLIDGRYTLGEGDSADITGTIPGAPAAKAPPPNAARPDNSKQSWAQQMFNYPDVTGAAGESKAAEAKEAPKPARPAAKPEEPKTNTGWIPVPVDSARPRSPAEQAILERLQERRNELDARARELEMRESLIKAAEKRLEGRVAELKELEARINNAVQTKEEGEAARFKNLVTMYENMKAKEAAKIFDRLDTRVLFEVATQISPAACPTFWRRCRPRPPSGSRWRSPRVPTRTSPPSCRRSKASRATDRSCWIDHRSHNPAASIASRTASSPSKSPSGPFSLLPVRS